MEYQTLHFGLIECDDTEVIHMPCGVTPFAGARRFILLSSEEEHPFSWLQSLDDPALAFVVAPLDLLFPEYAADVLGRESPPADRARAADIGLLGITVLHPERSGLTVNLLAPVLVDFGKMEAHQLILDGPLELARSRLEPALEARAAA